VESLIRLAQRGPGLVRQDIEPDRLARQLAHEVVGAERLAQAPELAQEVAGRAAPEPVGTETALQVVAELRLERPCPQVQ